MAEVVKMKPVRLALRVEGVFWNAYLARADTMVGAILLGSIQVTAVQDEERKARFVELMKDVLSATVGVRMMWPNPLQPAPEHERSGSAVRIDCRQ